MRALGLACVVAVVGCDREVPAPIESPATRLDVPTVVAGPEPKPRAKPEPAPLAFELAPRPATLFVSQSCLSAPAPSVRDARSVCARRKRSGDGYERRQCRCDAEEIVEVAEDAAAAFYVGCCWTVGDTPQAARDACQARIEEGCEAADPEQVHAAIGPFERREPFREFDGPDFAYLVPSDLTGGWIADNGEGPCFPDGTPVELADGPRPIEAVEVGDEVVTFRDGRQVVIPVLGIKVRETDRLLVFGFDEGTLRLTPNHLVWLDQTWQAAREVEEGDVLTGLEGPRVVRRIEEEQGRVTVRTLRVEAPNSFFAGGIWVHNY